MGSFGVAGRGGGRRRGRRRTRRRVESRNSAANAGTNQQEPQQVASSPTEELQKLGQLRDSGVITDEEFEAKKKELLAKI